MKEYGSKVTLQTVTGDWCEDRDHITTDVCVVDLTKLPSISIPVDGERCHVISRSDDVYTIAVSRRINASEAGLKLQAVVTSQSGVLKSSVTTTIGQLPVTPSVTTFKEPEITYQIDDGDVRKIHFDGNIYVKICKNRFVPVRFCARDAPEGRMLKIFANGQETKSQEPCVEAGYRLNITERLNDDVTFEYGETMCHHRKGLVVRVEEQHDGCDVCDVKKITPTNACSRRPDSKAREIVTLSSGYDVMCDTETDGGNWIVFQRRNSSDVDFYHGWDNYTKGFGLLSGNFWLGLDTIHSICNKSASCQLRVDIVFEGKKYHATYQDFYIDGQSQNFRLHVAGYSGDAGDALTNRGNGQSFSTKDRDNDKDKYNNCAQIYYGAWWYDSCHAANLNGLWGSTGYGKGLNWHPTTGYYKSATLSEMKLRFSR